ncbi:glycoside hydrolase family 16 protein [Fodinicola feengrottensis]|uniref:glycoside hydrolase family 16 protein n=1 Tax=Fodinicola feengrottensis TaxID=435914 RepID=UPI0031D8A2EF
MTVTDRRYRLPAALGAAVAMVATAAAIPIATSAYADSTNLATNPVLASSADGWGALGDGSGKRVAITGHPTASYAYQVKISSGDAGIYMPQLSVTGGSTYTISVDANLAGKANIQMDWYGEDGYISSTYGPAITAKAGSWTKIRATLKAPAGATNSHPLETVSNGSGTWQSTAADYEAGGGSNPSSPPPSSPPPSSPPPSSPPPSSPPPGDGSTAAGNFHWGTPLPASDEFNYTGTPDSAKWGVYGGDGCVPGHDGNGRRCGNANYVNGSYLRQTGSSNGDTAGMASNLGQKYGRWEVRSRIQAAPGANGNAYHPVLITWPDSDAWPSGGEYDYFEVNVGDDAGTAFMHHPTQSGVVQDEYHSGSLDLSQWHNYGFEWSPNGLTGYIDGQQWFHDTDPDVQAPGPMHQTIQLDNFFGDGMQQAYFDVDWARVYSIS